MNINLLQRFDNVLAKFQSIHAATNEILKDGEPSRAPFLYSRPIGFIRSAFTNKNGTPRQGAVCSQLKAELKISKDVFTNPEHSLHGILEFSHLWLIFWFHENGNFAVRPKVKPPRLGGTTKGVYTTRSPHRPNPIGLSLVRLEEVKGDTLIVSGIDLIDGTPILDIKPYIEQYDKPEMKQDVANTSGETWVSRVDKNKILQNVEFSSSSLESLKRFHSKTSNCQNGCEYCLEFIDPGDIYAAIDQLLKSDLRSVYRKLKCSDRIQFITIDSMKLSIWYDESGIVHVLNVCPKSKIDDSSCEEN